MEYLSCPICHNLVPGRHNNENLISDFDCFRCGSFRCDHYAIGAFDESPLTEEQIANASGYVRRNAGLLLTAEKVAWLSRLPTPSVASKAAAFLTELGKDFPRPGQKFVNPVNHLIGASGIMRGFVQGGVPPKNLRPYSQLPAFKWLAVTSSSHEVELNWLFGACLVARGWVKKEDNPSIATITAQGWEEIARLRDVNLASRLGFVAMSFKDEFASLYEEGIAEGIEQAGYEPRRIDRTEHNNRIDDEIIASIKQSRFVVADFTMDRGGIYFEAGYGLGLGLPVIWLVRKSELESVHFDNRQYNFITWNDGEWDELAKRLRNRIEATIGRGPVEKRA